MRRVKPEVSRRDPLQRLSEWILLLVVGLFPLVHWPFARDENLAKPLFIALDLAGLFVLLAVRAVRGEPPRIRWNVLDAAVGLYCALTCLSWLWSDFRHATTTAAGRVLLCTMLYLAARLALREGGAVRAVALALVAGGMAVSVVGLVERSGWLPWSQPGPVGSTWFNRTYLAAHLLLVLPLAAWAAVEKRTLLKVFGALALATGALVLFFTEARIAWVALAPMAVVAAISAWPTIPRSGRGSILAGVIVVVTLVGAVQLAAARFAPNRSPAAFVLRTFGSDQSGANTERKSLMVAALRIARDYPLVGTGAGTFGMYAPPRLPREAYAAVRKNDPTGVLMIPTHAHNEFLEVLAELGHAGLLAFCAMPIGTWVLTRRTMRGKEMSPGQRALSVALITGVTGFLCSNMVGISARVPGEAGLFYTCLALIAATASPAWGEAGSAPRGRLAAAMVAAAAASAVIGWSVFNECRASGHIAAGVGLLNSYGALGPASAREHFEKACMLTPSSPEAHYDLGNALALMGKFREALREYEVAEKLSPHYGRVHFNKGTCYAQLGDYARAEREIALAYWQDRLPDSRATLRWLRRMNE